MFSFSMQALSHSQAFALPLDRALHEMHVTLPDKRSPLRPQAVFVTVAGSRRRQFHWQLCPAEGLKGRMAALVCQQRLRTLPSITKGS